MNRLRPGRQLVQPEKRLYSYSQHDDDGITSTHAASSRGLEGEKGHIPESGPWMFDVVAIILARQPVGKGQRATALSQKGKARLPHTHFSPQDPCAAQRSQEA